MNSGGVLIVIPFGSNIGYAVETLEKVFFDFTVSHYGDQNLVHFAYKHQKRGHPVNLPEDFHNILEFNAWDHDPKTITKACEYVSRNNIQVMFGLDLPVTLSCYAPLRKSGIRKIISYWGAPMSSINSGWKIIAKKLEVRLRTSRPNHYIFESEAMRETATMGRGVATGDTSIVYLGVDHEKFKPKKSISAYKKFSIPRERKIVFYSGHMQERKGVRIIVQAAAEIVNQRKRKDIHFLFAGNKPGEEQMFDHIYKSSEAEDHITFIGYRNDLPDITPCCHLGVIASTGWDSFTLSSLEMQACGLPLIVSKLQGLQETINDGVTGFLCEPGNDSMLADLICDLISNDQKREEMGKAARERIVSDFTLEKQKKRLLAIFKDYS